MTRLTRTYRTVFISDLHLGTRGCQAEALLAFLNGIRCEKIYLVGDIVDGWRLKRAPYWTDSHSAVIRCLADKAAEGTELIYLPGNHDEVLREFVGLALGHIRIEDSCIHETADGRRLLVLHGDQFDAVVCGARWLALLGDWAYTLALQLNTWFNIVRRKFGKPYWSLSAYLKHRVKNACEFVSRFEEAVVEAAQRHDADGVVCGHIHWPAIRQMDGVTYCNTGDWVESCSALVEDVNGRLTILRASEPKLQPLLAARDDESLAKAA